MDDKKKTNKQVYKPILRINLLLDLGTNSKIIEPSKGVKISEERTVIYERNI
jgi:hypothetical protein